MGEYEIVIGMELHTQLKTRTKLFCGCSTEFGAEPNSQTCPVCLGLPGVLPVMNKKAFELALKAAVALNCRIDLESTWDRKNYYYPDQPKNYQISQDYHCLGVDGFVEIEVDGEIKEIGIDNIHLEEDAGKLVHPDGSNVNFSKVDLNRTGQPLGEIVTKPDMRSIEEAKAYMETMRLFLQHLDISDCKMQEGSLRFEPSVSLRPFGQEEYGNRVEIKNVNSVRFVVLALEYEIARQTQILDNGGAVSQETVLYDEFRNETRPMRRKEESHDYRYFPEPDLVPATLTEDQIAEVRSSIPELPLARKLRFTKEYELPTYDAGVLVEEPGIAEYFEECAKLHSDAKAVSNLIMNDVMKELNSRELSIGDFPVSVEAAADLLQRVKAGEVSKNKGREVFAEMVESGKSAGAIIEEKGMRQIGDTDEVRQMVEDAIAQNPKAAEQYKSGKGKAKGALVGGVMRASKGKADPQLVNKLIDEIVLG
ncbi:MAG: Asp-tRNA(Asn)/Glu-tRNA(Gln) amidotransferase subunit GatB [Planctomycetota bacterium]|jgi:aspartyl-tRNA(Asn)/glutamyl-tRNA(Gln) amidotransferase subunit B|nr:Asp-tRNA(Asn)/Glu-tRNA(Gln) amidotransferase subunit GatB [Planctomycetota bacterium]